MFTCFQVHTSASRQLNCKLFVLFSTPSCNVPLQRQTEAHLSRLMYKRLFCKITPHTLFYFSLHKTIYLSVAVSKFHAQCTSYFSILFSISYWKLEKLFPSYLLVTCRSTSHCKQSSKNDFKKLIYKPQCKDRPFSLTKTDLNVGASSLSSFRPFQIS